MVKNGAESTGRISREISKPDFLDVRLAAVPFKHLIELMCSSLQHHQQPGFQIDLLERSAIVRRQPTDSFAGVRQRMGMFMGEICRHDDVARISDYVKCSVSGQTLNVMRYGIRIAEEVCRAGPERSRQVAAKLPRAVVNRLAERQLRADIAHDVLNRLRPALVVPEVGVWEAHDPSLRFGKPRLPRR